MTNQLDASIATSLRSFPFFEHPAFLVYPREGSYSNYVFGATAYETPSLQYLVHEIAHAIEFGPEEFRYRCDMGNFRFRFPRARTLYVGGTVYTDRSFTRGNATARECRTVGIEYNLLVVAGAMHNSSAEEFCADEADTLGRFMNDAHLVDIPIEAQIAEAMHAYRDVDWAVDRFSGWLDKTYKRLRRRFSVAEIAAARDSDGLFVAGALTKKRRMREPEVATTCVPKKASPNPVNLKAVL